MASLCVIGKSTISNTLNHYTPILAAQTAVSHLYRHIRCRLFYALLQAIAITVVCFFLAAIALSSVYSMCKARRAREGMGYQEVNRPENSFEMMSLGGRDGVSMVLPQGY